MILIIDNYDSFTYNLCQYIGTVNSDIEVYRNNEITVKEIKEKNPSHIIISPGPKYPKDAGICVELIKSLYKKIPILGVCLGHQSIGAAFGGNVTQASKLMHGKADRINIIDKTSKIYQGFVGNEITVGRYHSLVVDENTMPDCLKVTAKSQDNSIMSLEHNEYPVYGVQYHPESVLTPDGQRILANFLKI